MALSFKALVLGIGFYCKNLINKAVKLQYIVGDRT